MAETTQTLPVGGGDVRRPPLRGPLGLAAAAVVVVAMVAGLAAARSLFPSALGSSNTVWAIGQIEVETGRLQLHLEKFARAPSTETLDALHERMDVLWSRAFMSGRVGERINAEGGHVLDEFRTDLEAIDRIVGALTPCEPGQVQSAIDRMEPWPSRLRFLTLSFLRSESAAASERHSRIEFRQNPRAVAGHRERRRPRPDRARRSAPPLTR